jgi:hypothetical protein
MHAKGKEKHQQLTDPDSTKTYTRLCTDMYHTIANFINKKSEYTLTEIDVFF